MAIMPDLVKPGSRRKRWILIAVAAVVVLGGIVAAAICCWPVTPPDPKENQEEAAKFLASRNFGRMKLQEQRDYIRSIGGPRALFRNRTALSESERRQAMENMRRIFAAEQAAKMRKFFAASLEEQNRMLDEDIARMKARRAEWEKRRAERARREEERRKQAAAGNQQAAQQPPRRPPPSAQERRQREASANPTTRAQHQVYRQLMRQRQKLPLDIREVRRLLREKLHENAAKTPDSFNMCCYCPCCKQTCLQSEGHLEWCCLASLDLYCPVSGKLLLDSKEVRVCPCCQLSYLEASQCVFCGLKLRSMIRGPCLSQPINREFIHCYQGTESSIEESWNQIESFSV